MLNPPDDLDASGVAESLERHWLLRVRSLTYLPVGFGAHHWSAETDAGRLFVTVHDLRLGGFEYDPIRYLARTFQAARALRDQARLAFVAAAVPSRTAELVMPLGRSYALSVCDWLDDVRPLEDPEGSLAAAIVAQLHRASAELAELDAPRETFAIPHRRALEAALRAVDAPWQAGPYAERARALLQQHAEAVRSALAGYEWLAARVRQLDRPWCLTHGEPNGSNLLQDAAGAPYLVDWDSARWAPAERDLWLLDHQPQSLAAYHCVAGGPPPHEDTLRVYRLWYDLAETAVYLLQFRQPHAADANMAEAWRNFQHFLPTRERWQYRGKVRGGAA